MQFEAIACTAVYHLAMGSFLLVDKGAKKYGYGLTADDIRPLAATLADPDEGLNLSLNDILAYLEAPDAE